LHFVYNTYEFVIYQDNLIEEALINATRKFDKFSYDCSNLFNNKTIQNSIINHVRNALSKTKSFIVLNMEILEDKYLIEFAKQNHSLVSLVLEPGFYDFNHLEPSSGNFSYFNINLYTLQLLIVDYH
jgi:hypothetical protein